MIASYNRKLLGHIERQELFSCIRCVSMKEKINCSETLQEAEGLSSSNRIMFFSPYLYFSCFSFYFPLQVSVYVMKSDACKYKDLLPCFYLVHIKSNRYLRSGYYNFLCKTADITTLISRAQDLKQWLFIQMVVIIFGK